MNRYKAGFLILCFSAFLGHSFMPHHHQAELFGSPLSSECPFEHTDQSGQPRHEGPDHDVPSSHCHAFNDVALEKINTTGNPPVTVQVKFLEKSVQTVYEFPAGDMKHLSIRSMPPGNIHLVLGPRALRAPPAFG